MLRSGCVPLLLSLRLKESHSVQKSEPSILQYSDWPRGSRTYNSTEEEPLGLLTKHKKLLLPSTVFRVSEDRLMVPTTISQNTKIEMDPTDLKFQEA